MYFIILEENLFCGDVEEADVKPDNKYEGNRVLQITCLKYYLLLANSTRAISNKRCLDENVCVFAILYIGKIHRGIVMLDGNICLRIK